MSLLLAFGLVGVLALAAAVGSELLAAGVAVAQLVFAFGVVRMAPIPGAGRAAWLALITGLAAAGWMASTGTPALTPMAKVLGPVVLVAIVLQLWRRDGRARMTTSLTFMVAAAVLAVLPAAWVGLWHTDSGRGQYAVWLGLLGVGITVLSEMLGVSSALRRLLAVLVSGAVAAGLVTVVDPATDLPAVGAVVIAAFGAVMAVAALAGIDRLAAEPVRRAEDGPLVVGKTAVTAERDVAAAVSSCRITLPVIVAAPVVYVLGRILVG
ncbi:MAG: hypothetical protein ACOC96_07905 [Actinomycetota bacterium]